MIVNILLIFNIFISLSFITVSKTNVLDAFDLKNQFIISENGINPSNCLYKFANNSIYMIKDKQSIIEKDELITLHKININENKKYFFKLKEKEWLDNFAVRGNYFAAMGQEHIYIYQFNDKELDLIKVIENKESYKDIIYTDSGQLILSRLCYSCDNPGVKVAVYDLNKNKYLISKVLPNPKGFPLATYQPRRLFSYSDNQFALADIIDYSINIYDSNLNLKEIIKYKPNDWYQNQNFQIELSKVKSDKDIFNNDNYFTKLKYKNSSIQLVDLIDASTLMVCWSADNSPNINGSGMPIRFFYDIWKKDSKSKWITQKSNMEVSLFHKSDKFVINEFNFIFTGYVVDNGRLIFPSTFPLLLNSFNLINITFSEIMGKAEKHKLDNGLNKISFFIYKLVE